MDCAPLGLSLGKRRGAGDSVCDINAHGLAERRLAERTKRVRDDSTPTATTWRLSGRQFHFRLRLASPDRGQRATPVHDRAGAQDRTQLLPQEEQR